jgi:hypothetical protein
MIVGRANLACGISLLTYCCLLLGEPAPCPAVVVGGSHSDCSSISRRVGDFSAYPLSSSVRLAIRADAIDAYGLARKDLSGSEYKDNASRHEVIHLASASSASQCNLIVRAPSANQTISGTFQLAVNPGCQLPNGWFIRFYFDQNGHNVTYSQFPTDATTQSFDTTQLANGSYQSGVIIWDTTGLNVESRANGPDFNILNGRPTPTPTSTPGLISFIGRNQSSMNASGATVTVEVPPGTRPGDFIYVVATSYNSSVAVPTGWNSIGAVTSSASDTSVAMWKSYASGDGSFYTFGPANWPKVILRVYRGAHSIDKFGSASSNSAVSSLSLPALPATSSAGELYVGEWFADGGPPIHGPADLGNGTSDTTQWDSFDGDKALGPAGNSVPPEQGSQ